MDGTDVLHDAFGRMRDLLHGFSDLDPDVMARQPAPGSNSIAWLLWHSIRVQDSHAAELVDEPQLWVSDGFAERLGFEPNTRNTGYGHSAAEAAAVRIDDVAALLEYDDAVTDRTLAYLDGIAPDELDRVIDTSYDPPVTVGVRLVSVVSDSLQHLGQAAYARGILDA